MSVHSLPFVAEVTWVLTDKYRYSRSQATELAGDFVSKVQRGESLSSDLTGDRAGIAQDILRVLSGEPMGYVIGWARFGEIVVDLREKPLIPRPETEWLVEQVVGGGISDKQGFSSLKLNKVDETSGKSDKGERIKGKDNPNIESNPTLPLNQLNQQLLGRMKGKRVLDLCTGSGCIAVALGKAWPEAEVVGADISAAALRAAELTRTHNSVTNVEFIQADLFTPLELSSSRSHDQAPQQTSSSLAIQLHPLSQPFDLIISNPPYIDPSLPHDASLDFEPPEALFAVDQGLAIIKRILREAPNHLNPGGWLILEHGETQTQDIQAFLNKNVFSPCSTKNTSSMLESIASLNDQFGKQRFSLFQNCFPSP